MTRKESDELKKGTTNGKNRNTWNELEIVDDELSLGIRAAARIRTVEEPERRNDKFENLKQIPQLYNYDLRSRHRSNPNDVTQKFEKAAENRQKSSKYSRYFGGFAKH